MRTRLSCGLSAVFPWLSWKFGAGYTPRRKVLLVRTSNPFTRWGGEKVRRSSLDSRKDLLKVRANKNSPFVSGAFGRWTKSWLWTDGSLCSSTTASTSRFYHMLGHCKENYITYKKKKGNMERRFTNMYIEPRCPSSLQHIRTHLRKCKWKNRTA